MRQRRQGHGKTLVGSHGSGDEGMMVGIREGVKKFYVENGQ